MIKTYLINIYKILKNNINIIENNKIVKITGSICSILVLSQLHLIFYFFISNFILIIALLNMFSIIANLFINIFQIKAPLKLENVLNIFKFITINILMYKIYLNNIDFFCLNYIYIIVYLILCILLLPILIKSIPMMQNNYNINNDNKLINQCLLQIFISYSHIIFFNDQFSLFGGSNNMSDNINNSNDNQNTPNKNNNTPQVSITINDQRSVTKGIPAGVAVSMTTVAAITKGQPPVQRALYTLGGGLGGGAITADNNAAAIALSPTPATNITFNATLNVNTPNATPSSSTVANTAVSSTSTNTITGPSSNSELPDSPNTTFINSPNEENLISQLFSLNPVEAWIEGLLILNIVNLLFTIILLTTVISKLLLSLNYKLNWLNKILPESQSKKVKSFLLKTFAFFAKIREFNIIMIILSIIFISIFILYYFSLFYFNLEYLCKLYLELLQKK